MSGLLIQNILIGVILMIAGLVTRVLPPKNPNSFYGYRTSRSMKTRSAWRLANEYFSGGMILISSASILIGLLTTIIIAKFSSIITITATIGLIIGLFYKTEVLLKQTEEN
jgi:uncharacterized membrane protein